MHFKGRLSVLSGKVLLFSPLSSCLRRSGLPCSNLKPLSPVFEPQDTEPVAPGPGKGLTCSTLASAGSHVPARLSRSRQVEVVWPWGTGAALNWVRACSPWQPPWLSSSFVPELIYFLSTSDVCYLDF